jgi:hypothetical protein
MNHTANPTEKDDIYDLDISREYPIMTMTKIRLLPIVSIFDLEMAASRLFGLFIARLTRICPMNHTSLLDRTDTEAIYAQSIFSPERSMDKTKIVPFKRKERRWGGKVV